MRSCSCQQMSPPEQCGFIGRTLFTFLPIAVALILLPAIAFASPPDPSWIGGIYDGSDGDDIVSLVYESSAARASGLSHVEPLPCLPKMSLEEIVLRSLLGHRFTHGSRSPPVLSTTKFAYAFASLPPEHANELHSALMIHH